MSASPRTGPMVRMDAAQRGHGPYVWRFRGMHRFTHLMAILTFYTLALTGIPLRFTCAPWSDWLVGLFGGVERAGLIHRGAAVVTLAYVGAHLGHLLWRFARSPRKRDYFVGGDSIVPQPRDVADFLRMWRYFLGRGARPRFPRYSYLEKLDYWGEVWGFLVIGGSGLLLWAPEFFARFLPGWAFNVADIFHSYEALIAICFLFTVHFFNVHLRPDKFPMDAVMFTGRATMEYMEEEHPEMVADWRSGRKPADPEAPAPGRVATIVAAVFGYLALGVGLAIIGMIVWALNC